MAKGPEITDEIRILVTQLHREHPKWTNSMIRNEVLSIMHKKNPSLPRDWPSKYSVDRIMPDIRKRMTLSKLQPNPLDRPWNIHSMVKHPIPPEALPSVLRVWYWAKDINYALTIREAQWVARLYATIDDMEALFAHSNGEAWFEKDCEEAGIEYKGTQVVNLWMFSTMTGQKINGAEQTKVIKLSDESTGLKRIYTANPKVHTDKPWPHPPERLGEGIEWQANKHMEKEAQDERQHKAKKQK